MLRINNVIYQSVGFALAATTISMTIAVFGLQIPLEFSVLETAAVLTSFACTYLCVMQSRHNYIIGVVTTFLYSILFYQASLIGSMALNIYLIPTLIYGWFIWGPDDQTKKVEHVLVRNLPLYIGATVLTYLGAVVVVSGFGGEMAALDSWILIGTILAQYLLDRKKIETWAVWVAVNIVSMYVYWNAELYLVFLQYVFFLGNTMFGAYMWNRSMKND